MSNTKMDDFEFQLTLSASHPVLDHHRVHESPIVPGVTWINILVQVLLQQGLRANEIEFADILFPSPLSLSGTESTRLFVQYSSDKNHLSVASEGDGKNKTKHCICKYVHIDNQIEISSPSIEGRIGSDLICRQLDDVYANARRLSIKHGDWMQGQGEAWLSQDAVVADIRLGASAEEGHEQYPLHPALLDCATLVPFAAGGFGIDPDTPFIPMAIQSIRVHAVGFKNARVIAKLSDGVVHNKDILHNDLWLVDEDGNTLITMRRLSAKRIRNAESLQKKSSNESNISSIQSVKPSKTPHDESKEVHSLKDQLADFFVVKTDLKERPSASNGFYDLGLDSSTLLNLSSDLEKEVGIDLYPTVLYENGTLELLTNWLESQGVNQLLGFYQDNESISVETVSDEKDDTHQVNLEVWLSDFIFQKTSLGERPNSTSGFYELGLDSSELLTLASDLEVAFGRQFYPTLCYEHSNVRDLSDYLMQEGISESSISISHDLNDQHERGVDEPTFDKVELVEYWQEFGLSKIENNNLHSDDWFLYESEAEIPRDRRSPIDQLLWKPGIDELSVLLTQSIALAKKIIQLDHHLKLLVWINNDAYADALTPFLRSLCREHTKVSVRLITGEFSQKHLDMELACFSDSPQSGVQRIRYIENNRQKQAFSYRCREQDDSLKYISVKNTAKAGAVVLTGGNGAIGLALLDTLIEQGFTAFSILARSEISVGLQSKIKLCNELGVEIQYLRSDVTDIEDLTKQWQKIKLRFGSIAGVLHCAGIVNDALLRKKNADDAHKVFHVKYTALSALDELSKDEPLEFFSACGSLTGVIGNLGQADYAFANGAMLGYMQARDGEVKQGLRSGKSLILHWPYWREGGMQIDAKREKQLARETGLLPMETNDGQQAFLTSLQNEEYAYLPLLANESSLSQFLNRVGIEIIDDSFLNSKRDLVWNNKIRSEKVSVNKIESPTVLQNCDPIAVIGIAGEYPQAPDLDTFWENLHQGRDTITPVPEERWNHEAIYAPERGRAGTVYSKDGGFIDDYDRFDAAFFNITPREAKILDPQERRFLQIAWSTVENAGMNPAKLNNTNIGVYVGVMWGQYQMCGQDDTGRRAASIYSAIANRVSYSLNLTGPSMALDTMCSSSLSAVHLAVQAIRRGECELALAGGVNLMSHPHKYQFLCQNQMLSDDGRCRSFGEGGSGYVPGEGVGAILLKPLTDAERDGNIIHALVLSSALNHGGRAAGMTVPSPGAQAKVVRAAQEKAFNHRGEKVTGYVRYIEAHGTGTSIGDPIEVEGLHQAMSNSQQVRCAIGSVKSNIGHLESAAGIAAISKTILQMRNKRLVASLHTEKLNQKLRLDDSKFYVQTTSDDWEDEVTVGRIAGISAFGAGGSNAHVVLQESPINEVVVSESNKPVLIPISAKSSDALLAYAQRWRKFLSEQPHVSLTNIAKTAQFGRQAYEKRIILCIRSHEAGVESLDAWLGSEQKPESILGENIDSESLLNQLSTQFISGYEVDWSSLYKNVNDDSNSIFQSSLVKSVEIPSYPFQGERYLISDALGQEVNLENSQSLIHSDNPIDELLHQYIPSLDSSCFSSYWEPHHPLLQQHKIGNHQLMPAAMMLETMHRAVKSQSNTKAIELVSMTLGQSCITDEEMTLKTELFQLNSIANSQSLTQEVGIELSSAEGQLFCQAVFHSRESQAEENRQIEKRTHMLDSLQWNKAEHLYEDFSEQGLHYGPHYRGIKRHAIDDQGGFWADLELPKIDSWMMAILAIDAAMQASVLALGDIRQDNCAWLPCEWSRVHWSGDVSLSAFVRVNSLVISTEQRIFQISLMDKEGNVLWVADEFKLKAQKKVKHLPVARQTNADTQLLSDIPSVKKGELHDAVVNYISSLLAEESGLSVSQVKSKERFEYLGVDSVAVLNLTYKMEKVLGTLPKSLFFDVSGVQELSEWLVEQHGAKLRQYLNIEEKTKGNFEANTEETGYISIASHESSSRQAISYLTSFRSKFSSSNCFSRDSSEPIAVIGMAGRFPDAENVDVLWENLNEKKDSVKEIPADRWPWQVFFSPDKKKGSSYCKFGSFLDDVYSFDASFFNMTPADAELADPQERIMLETAWHTMENAGYSRQMLKGQSVGVYVASMWQQYQHYGVGRALKGDYSATYSLLSSTANRISYTMGITGPSVALDTMCSGSLTALHLAVTAIQNNECDAAFVGGVNLSVHPLKYLTLSQGGFLSERGRCAAFGQNADGYVPGEGAACLMIKPLSRAQADGDPIHGLIRATAINHTGTTSGSTVPSSSAQTEVIRSALRKSGVKAEQISYVEAHGTGTALGDPIEIDGLNAALNEKGDHPGCRVGSIKSNLGHLEAAAGVTSIVKTLLQFKHRRCVASLHSEVLNSNLNLSETPFTVVQDTCDLESQGPLFASVNSFGAGGSNAHVILESHTTVAKDEQNKGQKEITKEATTEIENHQSDQLVIMSAASQHQLQEMAGDFASFLSKDRNKALSLECMTATLMLGREHKSHRIAITVCDLSELMSALDNFSQFGKASGALQYATVSSESELQQLFDDTDGRRYIDGLIQDRRLSKLAQLWLRGAFINWSEMFDVSTQRLSLPGYRFKREEHKVETSFDHYGLNIENTSDLYQQSYRVSLPPWHPVIADHIIDNQRLVPLALMTNLCLAVLEKADDEVIWSIAIDVKSPWIVKDTLEADIVLEPRGAQVVTGIYVADTLVAEAIATPDSDISIYSSSAKQGDVLQTFLEGDKHEGSHLYQLFDKDGFSYGDRYQAIRHYSYQNDIAVAKLGFIQPLPIDNWNFEPGLMDAGLQLTRVLVEDGPGVAWFPIGINFVDYSNIKPAYVQAELINRNEKTAEFTLKWICSEQSIVASAHLTLARREAELEWDGLYFVKRDWCAAESVEEKDYSSISICELEKNDLAEFIIDSDQYDRVGAIDSIEISDIEDNSGVIITGIDHLEPESAFWSLWRKLRHLHHRGIKKFDYVFVVAQATPLIDALAVWMRAVEEEIPGFRGRVLLTDHPVNANEILSECSQAQPIISIRNGQRQCLGLKPLTISQQSSIDNLTGQVVLVTGGAGGLGKLFAQHLASVHSAHPVLVGRRQNTEEIKSLIASLRAQGVEASYYSADTANDEEVDTLMRKIMLRYGRIDGVIHAAGVSKDAWLSEQNEENVASVLAPKVKGSHKLIEALIPFQPSWMATFSSVSGFLGNPGQTDYSFANAYMDAFFLSAKKKMMDTRVVCINWPLWDGVGMQVDEGILKHMESRFGMRSLPAATGLRVFDVLLAQKEERVLPLFGHPEKLAHWLSSREPGISTAQQNSLASDVKGTHEEYKTKNIGNSAQKGNDLRLSDVKSQVASAVYQEVGIAPDNLDWSRPLDQFGISSVSATAIIARLEEYYGSLPKTLLYECENWQDLSSYIEKEKNLNEEGDLSTDINSKDIHRYSSNSGVLTKSARELVANAVFAETSIAPENLDWSRNIDEFGISSVVATSIVSSLEDATAFSGKGALPKTLLYECQTWSELADYLDSNGYVIQSEEQIDFDTKVENTVHAKPNQNISKAKIKSGSKKRRCYRFAQKGGDLAIVGLAGRYPDGNDLDDFWEMLCRGDDAVKPIPEDRWNWKNYAEANKEESQKGGFLSNIDSFDHNFFSISFAEAQAMDPQERLILETTWHSLENAGINPGDLSGKPVGVYMGAMWNQYQMLALDSWRSGEWNGASNGAVAAISNRISFLLNLQGPSLTLDSMCSSALSSLKLASDALRSGEIDVALVGGVNLSLHPFKYHQLTQTYFLSPEGRCGSFGEGGDGYVPGEGVGVLVLKRAEDAKRHGDHVRALLKGIAVNHGGRANGFYVPRPQAQAQVIQKALENAEVSPSSISYIEAHGTGTKLGDPIEMTGIKQGYGTAKSMSCALGSVKANIGHSESAAGMAALSKVVLQLEKRTLVPSIHSTPQNPELGIEGTGLYVQTELNEWSPSLPEQNCLRAGVSSFGAGGSNVHLILEEGHQAPLPEQRNQDELVIFSADDEDRLKAVIRAYLVFLENQAVKNHTALAASTQIGRDSRSHRLACVCSSIDDLKAKLHSWLNGEKAEDVIEGRVHQANAIIQPDESCLSKLEWFNLAKQWIEGAKVEWKLLWPLSCGRLELPLYPFKNQSVWIKSTKSQKLNDHEVLSHGHSHRVDSISKVDASSEEDKVDNTFDESGFEERVIAVIADVFQLSVNDFDIDMPFERMGMDSVSAAKSSEMLAKEFLIEIDPTLFFNYPTTRDLIQPLTEKLQSLPKLSQRKTIAAGNTKLINSNEIVSSFDKSIKSFKNPIAVIGMSGAFAGAKNLNEFWENLKAGEDSVSDVPLSRWPTSAYFDPEPGKAGKTCSTRMGLLSDIDKFDAAAFNFMPDEVTAMDPQQRLFLKHSILALDDAAISQDTLNNSMCGVFAGTMTGSYRAMLADSNQATSAFAMLGNHAAALPARVAYHLNLKGPTLAVDTACSSSLVAVHLACQALKNGECSMAFAGGVFVSPGPQEQLSSSAAGMLSPDGSCKTFDDNANGIAIGEGVGVILLKSLSKAINDGDIIHGLIRNSGINQDGKTNGITAPNALSQAELISDVFAKSELGADDIQYLECHGTGTRLGDPVEIEGIRKSLSAARKNVLPIGSVKPNIGHCYAAAGIASFMKVILSLKHNQIPPSIHSDKPNALINFDEANIKVNRSIMAWPVSEHKRAALSSFGYSGTNAHFIIEQSPPVYTKSNIESNGYFLLPISARKPALVLLFAKKLASYIKSNNVSLSALASTLQKGRTHELCRSALVVSSIEEAIQKLSSLTVEDVSRAKRNVRNKDTYAINENTSCEDLLKLAASWCRGESIDWFGPFPGSTDRITLPSREFDEKSYWPKDDLKDEEFEMRSIAENSDSSQNKTSYETNRQCSNNNAVGLKEVSLDEFKRIA